MPDRVVDASVLAAFAFNEPRASEAASLIEGVEMHAPALLAYEMTNIAWKKARLYPNSVPLLELALVRALSMDIHWVEVSHGGVLHLAIEKNISTYDACYLYLARTFGIPLVTFDIALRTAAER